MILSIKRILRRQIRSSRFYKYFFSYIVLLLITLLILGGIIYRNFISTLQQEIEISNISSLKQIVNVMDTRFREMDRTALHINSNLKLRAYMIIDSGFESLEAIGELSKYKSSNEFLKDIILFHDYHGKQKMFSPGRDSEVEMFFNFFYNYENWGKDGLLNTIATLSRPIMRPVERITLNRESQKNFATYIYPLPLGSVKPISAVLFLIEEDIFRTMVKDVLKNYEGLIYIMDDKENLIYNFSEGKNIGESTQLLKLINNKSYNEIVSSLRYDAKNYSVVRLHSDYNNWSYVTVIETSQFMEKFYTKRDLFSYATFFVLLMGIIIAFTLATGSYKPLADIAERINILKKELRDKKYNDELLMISNTIEEVSRENEGLVSEIKSKKYMLKEQAIRKLLRKKSINHEDLNEVGELSELGFNSSYFVVLIFFIDNFDEFRKSNDENNQELVRFSIVNVAEELSEEIGKGHCFELEDGRSIALILNFDAEYGKERYISELAFKTKDFFKQHFHNTLTIGVGSVCNGIENINRSYAEGNRAVYYRFIKGNDNVIFYEDIKDISNRSYRYPTDKENDLVMCIKQGESNEARRIIGDIKDYIVLNQCSPDSVRYIFFCMVNAIIKTIDEMELELCEEFNLEKQKIFEGSFETINDMCNRISDFCIYICSYLNELKESRNFELRDKILTIINERYSENTLSLESIADEFNMSPSYISRYFKNQTGTTLMKYIDIIRMNKAKELLRNTSLVIREIVNSVGYVDEANFMRKFRKNEGMTAMQYRNIAQKEINNADTK